MMNRPVITIGEKENTNLVRSLIMAKVPLEHHNDRISIAPGDLWSGHIVGAPGEGKSVLMGNLVEFCMDAGESCLVLDPHGDLAEDIVMRTNTLSSKT